MKKKSAKTVGRGGRALVRGGKVGGLGVKGAGGKGAGVATKVDVRGEEAVVCVEAQGAVCVEAGGRGARSDARRNRERILEVARDAFRCSGANASLDEVARQAGVGAGTLYRHFPTRDALIEAVYHSEVEKLAAAAVRFGERLEPVEALRRWMLLFVEHIAAKLIFASALNSVEGGPEKLYAGSRALIGGAMEMLVKGAMESGEIRPDVEAGDLLRVMIGIAQTTSIPGWEKSAKRLVEIVIAGSRVGIS